MSKDKSTISPRSFYEELSRKRKFSARKKYVEDEEARLNRSPNPELRVEVIRHSFIIR